MIYQSIAQHKDEFAVARQCAVLGVSESGYYDWCQRPPSQREQENEQLKADIYECWQAYEGVYGAPRIHAELQEQGHCVGRNRVARLMRGLKIQGKMRRKKRPRTTVSDAAHPVAPNVLNRKFVATRPDEVWLTDITYIDTEEGYLYLAGVMDLYSRQIVGLAMADHMRTELVDTAFDMALQQRCPDHGTLHHSDRGSQYTSHAYQELLRKAGFMVSMSRTGNCLDNAPMESFWATLKRECADLVFGSRHHARTAIFGYIMSFYNRRRKHSALGYRSPVEFEQHHQGEILTPLN